MAFDLSTAKPIESSGGFDISTAMPIDQPVSTPQVDPSPQIDGAALMGQFNAARETGDWQTANQIMEQMNELQSRGIGGALEAVGTIGSAIAAEPIAGVSGIAASLIPGGQTGGEAVESTREALTYQPKTQEGVESLQATGEALAPVGEAFAAIEDTMGDVAFDITGRPEIAALAKTVPTAVGELLGLGILKKIRKGTQLIDAAGRPTKQLRIALDKQGLDFDNLKPEVQKAIPQYAEPKLFGGKNTKGAAEVAVIDQINQGGTDGALATLKVDDGRLAFDPKGAEAIRQGFDEGFVQSAKSANAATKQKMNRMTNIMRRIKKDERVGMDVRPDDIVGESVADRITFLRDRVSESSKELNQLAAGRLANKSADARPVVQALADSLDDLNVSMIDSNGIFKPEFKGSQISKDRTSQKVIKDVIDLMYETGEPSALKLHNLKKQLDGMIDYRKKSPQGLTDAGKKVAEKIRASINDSIRAIDSDYARVNDVMSESLDAIGKFDKATGSIDIFAENSKKAIGQKMRGLMSNISSRADLDSAMYALDDAAKNLGGTLDDDVRALVMYSNGLNDRFGTTAKTSLAGQNTQAAKQAMREGVTATAGERIIDKASDTLEKLQGVNDFNAFEAMQELLK